MNFDKRNLLTGELENLMIRNLSPLFLAVFSFSLQSCVDAPEQLPQTGPIEVKDVGFVPTQDYYKFQRPEPTYPGQAQNRTLIERMSKKPINYEERSAAGVRVGMEFSEAEALLPSFSGAVKRGELIIYNYEDAGVRIFVNDAGKIVGIVLTKNYEGKVEKLNVGVSSSLAHNPQKTAYSFYNTLKGNADSDTSCIEERKCTFEASSSNDFEIKLPKMHFGLEQKGDFIKIKYIYLLDFVPDFSVMAMDLVNFSVKLDSGVSLIIPSKKLSSGKVTNQDFIEDLEESHPTEHPWANYYSSQSAIVKVSKPKKEKGEEGFKRILGITLRPQPKTPPLLTVDGVPIYVSVRHAKEGKQKALEPIEEVKVLEEHQYQVLDEEEKGKYVTLKSENFRKQLALGIEEGRKIPPSDQYMGTEALKEFVKKVGQIATRSWLKKIFTRKKVDVEKYLVEALNRQIHTFGDRHVTLEKGALKALKELYAHSTDKGDSYFLPDGHILSLFFAGRSQEVITQVINNAVTAGKHFGEERIRQRWISKEIMEEVVANYKKEVELKEQADHDRVIGKNSATNPYAHIKRTFRGVEIEEGLFDSQSLRTALKSGIEKALKDNGVYFNTGFSILERASTAYRVGNLAEFTLNYHEEKENLGYQFIMRFFKNGTSSISLEIIDDDLTNEFLKNHEIFDGITEATGFFNIILEPVTETHYVQKIGPVEFISKELRAPSEMTIVSVDKEKESGVLSFLGKTANMSLEYGVPFWIISKADGENTHREEKATVKLSNQFLDIYLAALRGVSPIHDLISEQGPLSPPIFAVTIKKSLLEDGVNNVCNFPSLNAQVYVRLDELVGEIGKRVDKGKDLLEVINYDKEIIPLIFKDYLFSVRLGKLIKRLGKKPLIPTKWKKFIRDDVLERARGFYFPEIRRGIKTLGYRSHLYPETIVQYFNSDSYSEVFRILKIINKNLNPLERFEYPIDEFSGIVEFLEEKHLGKDSVNEEDIFSKVTASEDASPTFSISLLTGYQSNLEELEKKLERLETLQERGKEKTLRAYIDEDFKGKKEFLESLVNFPACYYSEVKRGIKKASIYFPYQGLALNFEENFGEFFLEDATVYNSAFEGGSAQ